MSSNDRPFITLPADQPDYETLSGLTLEQKAVLPARFHTPDWLDTTPGAFVCRVCWDNGEVTGWPCASALAGRNRVFADPVDAPAREVPAGDQPKPHVGALALAPDWDDKTNNVVIERVDANGCQVTNSQGQSWWVGMDRIEVLADQREPYVSRCVVCGKPGKEHPTGRWCLSDQLVDHDVSEVLADSEQVTR